MKKNNSKESIAIIRVKRDVTGSIFKTKLYCLKAEEIPIARVLTKSPVYSKAINKTSKNSDDWELETEYNIKIK